MLKLYEEFKRRKMFRPLIGYAGFAFVLIQVCSIVFPALLLPEWTNTFIVVLILLGFPVTIFFAWVYDITPEGIKKTGSNKQSVPDTDSMQNKSKKMLLPLTGFLTIVGGAFWIWSSLGDITSGSEQNLEMGIKKTIAVFNFDNLSGEKEGDHLCSIISENIRYVLTKLGKLDVKSRLVNKNKDLNDLKLDYYIEGTLSGTGENRNITVYLVNGQSLSNISTDQYKFVKTQIVTYQDTIVKNI